jgi:uncharacterized protein
VISPQEWGLVRRTWDRVLRSSMSYSVASVGPDGTPHVTPIGSVFLNDEPGTGFYLDMFNKQLSENVRANPRVMILGVDSGKLMWLTSLLRGRFVRPPGVRLVATVGPRRPSTEPERQRLNSALGPLVRTPGGRLLWRDLPHVRELRIEAVVPLRIGRMTESHPGARIPATTTEAP